MVLIKQTAHSIFQPSYGKQKAKQGRRRFGEVSDPGITSIIPVRKLIGARAPRDRDATAAVPQLERETDFSHRSAHVATTVTKCS